MQLIADILMLHICFTNWLDKLWLHVSMVILV